VGRCAPYAVTHGLCSPEDGHNDARNMLRQVDNKHLIVASCWFFSLSSQKLFVALWYSYRQLITQSVTRNLDTVFLVVFIRLVFLNYSNYDCINSLITNNL